MVEEMRGGQARLGPGAEIRLRKGACWRLRGDVGELGGGGGAEGDYGAGTATEVGEDEGGGADPEGQGDGFGERGEIAPQGTSELRALLHWQEECPSLFLFFEGIINRMYPI